MMEGSSPLVLTKICLPALRQTRVVRARLTELLETNSRCGFVLVSAPAGYGKTTLLLDWAQALQSAGTALAWYALDRSDDDALLFATYLVAAMRQALGSQPELERLAALLRSSSEIDLQDIVQSIINLLVSDGRDCVLLLDDYHLITRPAIHMALIYLLEHLPHNLRVVICSRADPPFPLARMRAKGHMLELRAAHLRFSDDETLQFLNRVMKLDVTQTEAESLAARTEGWAAGLQLAALSLSGQAGSPTQLSAFSGSHRFLLEYLLEEVVNRQPAAVQQFLFSTSILERMCAPLCDALPGTGNDSQVIIEQLFQSNLFVVALDGEGVWYRYHHLFRDSLRARLLKEQPQELTRLHIAASDWLAQHGLLYEAGQHAFAAQDWEYAAAFVEAHAFTMLLYSEIAIIHEWCAAFPEEVMQRHVLLCILQCWALVFRYRRRNRARIEERLSLAERIIASMPPGKPAGELREHAAVVRTFLSMAPDVHADAHQLLHDSDVMIQAYPEGDPGRFSALLTMGYAHMALNELQPAIEAISGARQAAVNGRLFFGIVESSFHVARLAQMQGHLQQAERMCRDTLQEMSVLLPQAEQQLPAIGCVKIALGCLLLEQDRLDEALEELQTGMQLAGVGTNPYYLLTACTALAHLYQAKGCLDEANAILAHLEERWPDIDFYTQILRLDMALRAQPQDAALRSEVQAWQQRNLAILVDDVPLPGMGPFGAAEAFYLARLAWLRTLLVSGKAQQVHSLLDILLPRYQEGGLANRVVELAVLQAAAYDVQGREAQALETLQQALQLGQSAGFVRSFDRVPALMPLLAKVGGTAPGGNYAVTLLERLEQRGEAKSRVPPVSPVRLDTANLVEELSERELEVLQLMAQGATNQDIAGTLVITVGTVKSHINHILRKLEASNRTEAVAKARRLRLPGI